MIIYLVGIGCVGKSTIGKMISEKIGFTFFDLDREIEIYYKKPIERLQEYREKGSVVLDNLLSKKN